MSGLQREVQVLVTIALWSTILVLCTCSTILTVVSCLMLRTVPNPGTPGLVAVVTGLCPGLAPAGLFWGGGGGTPQVRSCTRDGPNMLRLDDFEEVVNDIVLFPHKSSDTKAHAFPASR